MGMHVNALEKVPCSTPTAVRCCSAGTDCTRLMGTYREKETICDGNGKFGWNRCTINRSMFRLASSMYLPLFLCFIRNFVVK